MVPGVEGTNDTITTTKEASDRLLSHVNFGIQEHGRCWVTGNKSHTSGITIKEEVETRDIFFQVIYQSRKEKEAFLTIWEGIHFFLIVCNKQTNKNVTCHGCIVKKSVPSL